MPTSFRDSSGEPVNAVYGVTSMLISVLELIKPDYAVAALDGIKPTFRSEDFTGYKAHRKPMEDDLSSQIPKVFEIFDAFGIKSIVVDGYEADDVIGTLAKKFADDSNQSIIISNDRDLWQLVNKNVVVMLPTTSGKSEWIGTEEVQKRMGFPPEKVPDYKGLRGDPSDNIPGVHGIGDKTAVRLIEQFGTIEEIYKRLDLVEPRSTQEKLANNAEEAVLSKKLATIITDVPVTVKLEECCYNGFSKDKVKEVLQKYNFKSLLKRLDLDKLSSKNLHHKPDSGNNTSSAIEQDSSQTSLF